MTDTVRRIIDRNGMAEHDSGFSFTNNIENRIEEAIPEASKFEKKIKGDAVVL